MCKVTSHNSAHADDALATVYNKFQSNQLTAFLPPYSIHVICIP